MDLNISAFLLTILLFMCEAKKDRELYCAVCRALVDEINFIIEGVDPKKTLQVGSFRVDPKGNQATYKIPFARSELHLTEIMEGICEKFTDYAETTTDDGKKSIVRTTSRTGKGLNLKNISINSEKQQSIRHACDTIREDFEDELIDIFKKVTDLKKIEKNICGAKTELCSEKDFSTPMPVAEISGDENMEEELEAMKNEAENEEEEEEEENETVEMTNKGSDSSTNEETTKKDEL